MKNNLALYGREDVPNIPEHVADFRIKLLKENLKRHMSVHFMEQDTHAIGQIKKALIFWEKMKSGDTL